MSLAQPHDHVAMGGIREILHHSRSHHRPHIRYLLHRAEISLHQGSEVAEVRCKRDRGRLSHLADTEREQEPGQRGLTRLGERSQQVVRRLLPHAIESGERRSVELEEISRRLHEIGVHQLLHQPLAETLDIEGAARGEVAQPLLALRAATIAAGTTRHCGFGITLHGRAADRTVAGQTHFARVGRPAVEQHPRHFGDHVACAPYHDRIADAQSLALDLVDVVQGRIADGHAADEHRFETRHRRERTGASDLESDLAHHGKRLVGGEFVGDRPTRRTRDEAERPLRRQIVDLVDDPVDLVGQARPTRTERCVVRETTGDPLHPPGLGRDAQAKTAQHLEDL